MGHQHYFAGGLPLRPSDYDYYRPVDAAAMHPVSSHHDHRPAAGGCWGAQKPSSRAAATTAATAARRPVTRHVGRGRNGCTTCCRMRYSESPPFLAPLVTVRFF